MWIQFLGHEDPLEEEMATILVFLPGESQGQRSLVGHSPWGCKRVGHNFATKPHQGSVTMKLTPFFHWWMAFYFFLCFLSSAEIHCLQYTPHAYQAALGGEALQMQVLW